MKSYQQLGAQSVSGVAGCAGQNKKAFLCVIKEETSFYKVIREAVWA